MATPGDVDDWPPPDQLFEWLGENYLSRVSPSNTIVGVSALAVEQCYTRWYSLHRETVTKLDVVAMDLRTERADKASRAAVKCRNTGLERDVGRLEKEVKMLQEELIKAKEKSEAWALSYEKLVDLSNALRASAGNSSYGTQNTIDHNVQPRVPKVYDGSPDLTIVTTFLDEVENYARQGASRCPTATTDNQNMDTLWRFLSVKAFHWLEKEMKERDVKTIPPADSDYKIKWDDFKKLFKEQFVPEAADSVVWKEWHALRFNRNQVLKFNRRALELVEILGGSSAITRDHPLWEEYVRKLPEGAANDVIQEARLMRHLKNIDLTFSDMTEIVAKRTLPCRLAASSASFPSSHSAATNDFDCDPMDMSNIGSEARNIYHDKKCDRCNGFGHIARQCPTADTRNHGALFKQRLSSDQISTTSANGKGSRSRGGYEPRQVPRYETHLTRRQECSRYYEPHRPNLLKCFGGSNWRSPVQCDPVGSDRDLGRSRVGSQSVDTIDDLSIRPGDYFEGDWANGDGWKEE